MPACIFLSKKKTAWEGDGQTYVRTVMTGSNFVKKVLRKYASINIRFSLSLA